MGKSLVSAELEYGFDTHAGFYKAFKRQYGCSPKKYLKMTTAKKPEKVNLKGVMKIMLTKKQVKQLLSNWDISDKNEIENNYNAGGSILAQNAWSIDRKYILKAGKNISGLKAHIAVAKALAAEGMITTCPIETKNGEEFIIKDEQFYILFNRVEGNFLMPQERYDGNRIEIGRKYGEAIGKLHKVLKIQDKNIEANNSNLYEDVIDWALPETKRNMEQWGCPLPEQFFADYLKNFKELYPELPHQIIHRDANPSNIIFNNGEVSGFIDFEISERNIRLFDPCYCATGILSEAEKVDGGYEKWTELLQGIIKGYGEISKLRKEEYAAIPYVIYSIQMIFIAWLSGEAGNKNLAIANRKMLLWMWENRENIFRYNI